MQQLGHVPFVYITAVRQFVRMCIVCVYPHSVFVILTSVFLQASSLAAVGLALAAAGFAGE